MNLITRILIIVGIFSFIELYGYRALKIITLNSSLLVRTTTKGLYFGSFAIFVLMLLSVFIFRVKIIDFKPINLALLFGGFSVVVLGPKIVLSIFQLFQDIVHWLAMLVKLFASNSSTAFSSADTITRSQFITKMGVVLAAIPFFGLIWGIVRNRFNYDLKKVSLKFANLPENFNGIKIAQISDLHLGNFGNNPEKLQKAVDIINEQNCDFVFLTGDLVNILATEMDIFAGTLNNIKSKYGNFAILGNHDYGEYYQWDTKTEQLANVQRLIDNYPKTGFKLLLNDAEKIQVGSQEIAIIGIENWGLPPFPQYGDLQKAMETVQKVDFKLLLSHDPTFWDIHVSEKNDIALTMSGHTHGMQFAFEIPGWFKWSPVKYKYPKWSGLYQNKNQFLYVNVGLGVVGYPGRVGALPEITLFTLEKA